MTNHATYAMHAALAATGQLSGAEMECFEIHCERCFECRRRFLDMAQISQHLLVSNIHAPELPVPTQSLERFRSRALREGIPLSTPAGHSQPGFFSRPLLAALVLLCVALPLWMRSLPANTHGPNPSELTDSPAAATANQSQANVPVAPFAPERPQARKMLARHSRRALEVKKQVSVVRAGTLQFQAPSFADLGNWNHRTPASQSTAFSGVLPEAGGMIRRGYPVPSLSQMAELALFANPNEIAKRSTFGLASLHRTDTLPSLEESSFHFAVSSAQMQFRVSSAQ